MEEDLEKLKARILQGQKVICLHILGQSLVDTLCQIIRDQEETIDNMRDKMP